jgi:hypothetical protein
MHKMGPQRVEDVWGQGCQKLIFDFVAGHVETPNRAKRREVDTMDLAIFSKMHRPLPDIDFIGSCAELARRGLLPDEGLRRFVGYRTDKIGARVFNSAGATQRWVSNDGQAA